jgi:tRNA(Ile)-lysidine synthase
MRLTLSSFRKIIDKLNPDRGIILLAASGGVDSMVLAELLHRAQHPFALGHINYHLRGNDSDEDQQLVAAAAKNHGVPFHLYECSPDEVHSMEVSHTQETARKIRYAHLSAWRSEMGYQFLATAHHADDQSETMLHHFIRGTASKGLGGMQILTEGTMRPLLHFTKNDLLEFAHHEKIPWREDRSNAGNEYTRNQLRNLIIPEIRKINPAFTRTADFMSGIFRETSEFISERLREEIVLHVKADGLARSIPIGWLSSSGYPRLILWEILGPVGFTSAQMDEALQLVRSNSGKFISSSTHRLWKDRAYMILTQMEGSVQTHNSIEADCAQIALPVALNIHFVDRSDWVLSTSPSVAQLDRDKLQFPLLLRPWKSGDRLRPLGMRGTQTVSDLLTQHKVPAHLKSSVCVLESQGMICWVTGYRISEDFRVTETTASIWMAELV